MKPQQRKKLQQRAFHGMVGLPPEEPAPEPEDQDDSVEPEVSSAGETEIARETARIEPDEEPKEIVSASSDDTDIIQEDVFEELETEAGTKIIKKNQAHQKNPSGLRSVPHPVIPSNNPAAPYGYDDDYRPIGVPVGRPYVRPVQTGTVEKPKGPCKCGKLLCKFCHPEFAAQTRVLREVMHVAEDITTSLDWLSNFGPPTTPPTKPAGYPFFPEILGITRRTLLSLFDQVVAIEPRAARKRVLKSRAGIDKQIVDTQSSAVRWTARIAELKKLIEESNQTIAGLKHNAMKYGTAFLAPRDPDNIPDKSKREKFKYAERQKIAAWKQESEELRGSIRKLPKLDELIHQASNWGKSDNDYESFAVTVDGPVSFEEKFTLPRYFEEDHPGQSLETYTTFLRSNDMLMDSSARLRGYPHLDSWRYLENEIVRQAISWKLVKPNKAAIEKYPDLRGTWSEQDYAQDDTENALILKSGGTEIGATIYNFGTDVRGGSLTNRQVGDWDRTVAFAAFAKKKKRGVPGEARPSDTNTWTGDDDADSLTPD